MADMLVTVTLFDSAGTAQIAGPAMIKTLPTHPLNKVTAAFCRWLKLPEGAVEFALNGAPLAAEATALEAGVGTGTAIAARLAAGVQLPAAQGFTMLDVTDSELSALAGLMGVAR